MISGHDHCFVRVIITPIIIVANTIISMILFQSVGKSLTFRGTVFEASRFSISSISFRQYWIYFSQAIFNFSNHPKFSMSRQYWIYLSHAIFNQASHLINIEYFGQAICNFSNHLKFSILRQYWIYHSHAIFDQASHLIKLHKCADPVCDTQLLRVTWSFQHSPCRLLYLTILMTYSSGCVNGTYNVYCYWNCEIVKTEGELVL